MNALEAVQQSRDAITVRRVYGDPYQEEGITVIPAAHVMGGGGGGGDTLGNGGRASACRRARSARSSSKTEMCSGVRRSTSTA